jgi:putative nucleotidyltransferase with HDIG domain
MSHSNGTPFGDASARTEKSVEISLCNLPPFPGSAIRFLQISDPESVNLDLVFPVLTSDPSLVAELLRLANSPLFGLTAQVQSVAHAVSLLGFYRVKALVIAIAAKSYWSCKTGEFHRQCWLHSVATAVLAEEFAPSMIVRKEDAFTAGLLHDIGRIGLMKAYLKEYVPLLSANYNSIAESLTAENWLFSFDHCQSGSWLAKTWSFPEALQSVAQQHHAEIDVREGSLTGLIRVACMLADGLGYPELNCREGDLLEGLRFIPYAAQTKFEDRIPLIKKTIENKIELFEV